MRDLAETIADVCLAAAAVVAGVLAVLLLAWAGQAVAGDVVLSWTQDETVSVDGFSVERRDSADPATWVDLTGEPMPNGGGGPYEMTDSSLPTGVYRYRVRSENTSGASAWVYSVWVTVDEGEPAGQPPGSPTWGLLIHIFQ